MIGRADVVIPRPVDVDGKEVIRRVLHDAWPDAILEDAVLDDAPIALEKIEAQRLPEEFFVYRDEAARAAWDEHGCVESNSDSMLHVLLGGTTVTCVVDPNEGSETRALAARIGRAIEGLELPPIRGPVFEGLDDPADWIEAA